jgi:C-terminal processing protease CtpA/Prc
MFKTRESFSLAFDQLNMESKLNAIRFLESLVASEQVGNKPETVTRHLNRSDLQMELLFCLSSIRQYVRLLDEAAKRYDPKAYQDAKHNLERELSWMGRKLDAWPDGDNG